MRLAPSLQGSDAETDLFSRLLAASSQGHPGWTRAQHCSSQPYSRMKLRCCHSPVPPLPFLGDVGPPQVLLDYKVVSYSKRS